MKPIRVTKIENNVIDEVFNHAMSQFWDTVNLDLNEKYEMSNALKDKYYDKIDFELKICYNNKLI